MTPYKSWPNNTFPNCKRGPWSTILLHMNLIKDKVTIKVGNGKHTSFWCDRWLRASSLKEIFPRLLSFYKKRSSILELWDTRKGWSLYYRRNLKDEEIEEWFGLINNLNGVHFSTTRHMDLANLTPKAHSPQNLFPSFWELIWSTLIC